MALAAVCPSCSTRFRVVADQLKLKNGWVRCGSCGFAFNAVERLSYVPDDTSVHRRSALDELIANTRRNEGAAAPVLAAVPVPAQAEPDFLQEAPVAQPPVTRATPEPAAAKNSAAPAPVLQTENNTKAEGGQADVLPWPTLELARPGGRAEPTLAEPAAAPPPVSSSPAPAQAEKAPASKRRKVQPPPDDDPYELHTIIEMGDSHGAYVDQTPAQELAAQFLEKDAQDAARARRINRASAFGAALAAIALIGQLAFTFRNELAASTPGSRPVLDAMCEAAGCTIDLPAHASTLSLESLQLAQVGASDMYQATVLVKNTSGMTQRPPHLELTLTRVNGDILARRVLAPKEWLPKRALADGLPARGETVAQFALQVDKAALGNGAFSGFGGALFYPAP